MSVEGRLGTIGHLQESAKQRLQKGAKNLYKGLERKLTPYLQPNVVLDNPVYEPVGFDEEVQRIMGDGNHCVVGIGDHAAHPAGYLVMEVANYVAPVANQVLPPDQQLDRSTILFAHNIGDEKGQNETIAAHYKASKRIFRRLHIDPLLMVRPKDLRNMSREEFDKLSEKQEQELERAVGMGQMILSLPEGTVEAGRQKKGGRPGEIKGMWHLKPHSIEKLVEHVIAQKKVPMFVFVGTSGENTLYDPITESVPPQVKLKSVLRAIPGVRHFVQPSMSAIVDYPISYNTLVHYLGDADGVIPPGVLEEYVGQRIAQLIDPKERGTVYDRPTLLDKVPVRRINYEAVHNSPRSTTWTIFDPFREAV